MTKLSKILLTSMSIPAVATPLVTLTSCSQAWGYKTPFMIGSISEGPYETMAGAVDADGNTMDYLQNQYAIQSSNNTFYAYSTPHKYDQEKGWVPADSGWYQAADAAFASTATDKDGKQVTSARNATLASNVNFVSTIGNSINAYLSYALQYQAQQISEKNEDNLKIAWGGASKVHAFDLNHGTKGSSTAEQNNKFYEYLFALSNINGKEKSNAMLKTSNVNFIFGGNMPLPNYLGKEESRQFHPAFDYLLEGNIDLDFKNLKYWSSQTEETVEEEVDGQKTKYKYITYTYDAVPVVVSPTTITYTYLDPSRNADSFLVNDYYSSSDDVKNSIGNGWKEMLPKLTDLSEDNAIPHFKTFDIKCDEDESQIEINYGSITNRDKRLDTYGPYTDVIPGQSFIALIGYGVRICFDESGETHIPRKDTASITGIQNFFPAYFIDIYKDELFKKIKDDSDVYVFDQAKINEHNSKLLELIRRTGGEGYETDLSKLSDDSKNLLSFLGYMFGNDQYKINTESFLTPQDPIQ